MSQRSAQPDPEILGEELTAYLDGELDAETSRRIEELLATDASVRARLQKMERSWDLLDELERPELDAAFARSTLEMVTVAVEDDVAQAREEAPRRRRVQWLLGAAALVCLALAGFTLVLALRPDPNLRAVQEMPVLDRLEPYLQIEDLEWLRLLHEADVFGEEDSGPQASGQ